ncbi:hypothetical protein ECPA39_5003, partial [Escherichia coli PA39]
MSFSVFFSKKPRYGDNIFSS